MIRFASKSSVSFAIAVSAVACALPACGDAPKSAGFASGASSKPAPPPDPGGEGDPNGPVIAGDPTPTPTPQSDPSCAYATARGELLPVYLVFMFDRSGSMKFNPVPNLKWDACVAGLSTFFSDPSSAGLVASMQVFPGLGDWCPVDQYATPLVPATPLPDATGTFATALAANGPQPNMGTPTLPAYVGAVTYADSIRTSTSRGERVAVVLVTDGDPNECGSSTENVAMAAAQAAQYIPTYVIGVGDLVSNLNVVAQAGGTGGALFVDATNPQQITPNFVNAVSQIRTSAMTCELAIPAVPQGRTLDPATVNVIYTSQGSTSQTLPYNKDCAGASQGWHYDDPAKPSKIVMCTGSCNALKTTSGRLDLSIGCATLGGVTR